MNVLTGHWAAQQEFPGSYTGWGIDYYGAINGNSSALAGFNNHAPKELYFRSGGTLSPPYGVQLAGPVLYDFTADTGGAYGDINLGCSPDCNQPYQPVLNVATNGLGPSQLLMNESTGEWQLTSGGNVSNFSYFFKKTGFEMPTNVTPTSATYGYARMNFNSNYQVCLIDPAGTNHCAGGSGNVTGPASSVSGNIATFNGTAGQTIQDSGVNISPYLGGAWINLPTSGPSAIGTGGAGVNPLLAYAQANGYFFTDALAGDIAIRNALGQSIRLGINNAGSNAAASVTVNAAQVSLGGGIKLAGLHGSAGTTGVATLAAGQATVMTSAINTPLAPAGGAGDAIELTLQNCVSCGVLYINGAVNATSFVIKSSNAADASSVFWSIRHVN